MKEPIDHGIDLHGIIKQIVIYSIIFIFWIYMCCKKKEKRQRLENNFVKPETRHLEPKPKKKPKKKFYYAAKPKQIKKNAQGQDNSSIFIKRAGTTDKGKDYENYIVADFVLRLLKNDQIEDFKVWSNDENFGDFDDVIINIKTTDQDEQKYALQLKHVTKDKILAIKSLEEEQAKFSIKKYFKSFHQFKENFSDYKLILWTNLKIDTEEIRTLKLVDKEKFQVKIVECSSLSILNTSKTQNCCYRFEIVKDESTTLSKKLEEYETFFAKFFLYPAQVNVDQLKIDTPETIKDMLSCEKSVSDNYLTFISEWSIREGKKEKLDKEMMQRLLALLLIDDSIYSFSFTESVTANAKLLQKAASMFDITIFDADSINKVREVWGDGKTYLTNINEINKFRKQYQVSPKYVTDVKELTDEEYTKLLWVTGKHPIIVKYSPARLEAVKLCQDRKFVFVGTDFKKEAVKQASVFEKLADLTKFQEVYESVANEFLCRLPGKEVTLGELIVEDTELDHIITTNDLLKMVDYPYRINQNVEELPTPYISRYLSKIIVNMKFLLSFGENTCVVISNLARDDDRSVHFRNFHLVLVDQYLDGRPSKDSLQRKKLYISREEYCTEEFQEISQTIKKVNNFHCFKYQEEKLEWVSSIGSTSDLERFSCEDHSFVEEESLFCANFHNRVNIVTADPGMGKSTYMKRLKNDLITRFWTLIISPKDIFDFCKSLNGGDPSATQFEEFILKFKCSQYNVLEKRILRLLIKKGQAVYLWDALDEVSDQDRVTVENIIQELSQKVEMQWVTCRRHLKKILEDKFCVLSRAILPFDDKQQTLYIRQRLEPLSLDEDVDTIITAIKRNVSVISYVDILGTPLQIFMVTELFRQDAKKYLDLFSKLFSVVDLYRYFVEEKFVLYFKDKSDVFGDNYSQQLLLEEFKANRIKNYQKSALKSLFDEDLNVKSTNFLKKVDSKGDDLGFITEIRKDDMRPEFVHSSYAEYFAANYFVKKHKKIPYFEEIMFERKYTNVRYFFDMFLAQNSPAHVAVLCKNMVYLTQHADSLDCKDLHGRNVLQLACSWSERYPLVKMVKTVDHETYTSYVVDDRNDYPVKEEASVYIEMLEYLIEKCDPEEKEDLFQMTSVAYAEKCECLLALAIIEKKRKTGYFRSKGDVFLCSMSYYAVRFGYDSIIDLFDDIQYIENTDGYSLLQWATDENRVEYLHKLISQDNYKDNISTPNNSGETPLFIATWNGYEAIADLLIKSGANVNVVNADGATPLHIACQNGRETIATLLVKSGAQINVTSSSATPLYIAAQQGHAPIVDFLIKSGADIHAARSDGWTPIHVATYENHEPIVDLLIDAGADVNAGLSDGVTPLFIASENGYTAIAQLLVRSDADPSLTRSDGWTPLHVAAFEGHVEVVKLLLRPGHVNPRDDEGMTPLFIACENGFDTIADLIIKSGGNINEARDDGWTPLHVAACQGYDEIVDLLIEAGADTTVTLEDGATLLHCASDFGQEVIVKLLIEAGVDVQAVRSDGSSPLFAASQKGHEAIVDLLIECGASVNAKCDNGATPLFPAAENGHMKIAELLIEAGADCKLVTTEGWTPLHLAAFQGHKDLVDLLLKCGTDADAAINTGETALHMACQEGHDSIVTSLIASGANVEIACPDGTSPLFYASQCGHCDIVNLLIKTGAKFDIFDEDGSTPLLRACIYGHEEIVEVLIKHGADVDVVDDNNLTPVGSAFYNNQDEIMQLLNDAGADESAISRSTAPLYVFCKDGSAEGASSCIEMGAKTGTVEGNGWQPIHVACFEGHREIVEMLVEAGVDADVLTTDGKTPVELADENGHTELVEFINTYRKQ